MSSRETAARLLLRWIETADFPDRLLAPVDADRAFVTELVYGVVRRRRALDWLARQFAPRRPPAALRACLWVGLYQLLYMDNVPAHAAVNETVAAAARLDGKRGAGFVNGVLRHASGKREELLARLAEQPLGVRESHPDALVARWTRRWGEARAEALCAWNNTRPRVALRVNTERAGIDDCRARLAAAGIEAHPHPFAPERVLDLPTGTAAIDALPGFDEGLCFAQDPSTLLAVDRLDPQPGECVLDACAAPGGKAVAIGERLAGRGRLVCAELHEDRLARLRENLARMRVEAEVVCVDAASEAVRDCAPPGGFDRILLDAPCTNTGVLRRRADARWRFNARRLKALRGAQRRLLDNLAPLLRPGGTLVYSTCSLEREENEALIAAWRGANPEFALLSEETLFPPDTQTDGAYAAAIRKKE